MKTSNIILLFLLFSYSFLLGQTVNYKDLNASKKPKGSFQSYISKNGEIYSIGDTLEISKPSGLNGNFLYISKVDILLNGDDVGVEATNTTTVVKKIKVFRAGSGWKVNFQTKGFTNLDNYFINIEDAIESNEVKGKGMTSDEALSALKRAKEKLDLGLITEEEYNTLKEKLRKYIN